MKEQMAHGVAAAGPTMRLAEIRRYPVKSLRGQSLSMAVAERFGLSGDRRWVIVDESGKFITQRQYPALAQIDAVPTENGVELHHANLGRIEVRCPDESTPIEAVEVWRDIVPARIAVAAGAFFSDFLGRPARLAYLHDVSARAVDPDYGRADDRVTFTDGFPLLVTLTASLDDLNRRLGKPVSMDRFRANLVVDGGPAWSEDTWRRVQIGPLRLRIVKPCSRCAIPTFDPLTGEQPDGNEPLLTLSKFRRGAGGIMFGQNAIPDSGGCLRIGDAVEILESGPSNVLPIERREGSGGA
jgi:uncharacterized protein